jgi:hypothetical protein
MNMRLFLFFALMSNIAFDAAGAASLACPPQAPSEWRVANGRLEAVRVLAYLAGDTLNEDALPSGPPDREWKRDGILYQSWEMNEGAPQAVYQVDCLYSGTAHYLRLDASKVKRCLGRWKLRDKKVVEGSLVFNCE